MKSTGVIDVAGKEEKVVIFDCTPYYSTISKAAYVDDCALALLPWGSEAVKLNTDEKFVLESVTFFDSMSAAQRFVNEGK